MSCSSYPNSVLPSFSQPSKTWAETVFFLGTNAWFSCTSSHCLFCQPRRTLTGKCLLHLGFLSYASGSDECFVLCLLSEKKNAFQFQTIRESVFCKPNFFLPCCITLLDGILICFTQPSWARTSFLPNYVSQCLAISHLKQGSDLFLHAGIKFCNCRLFLCISFGLIMSKHGAGTPGGKSSGCHPRCWTPSQQCVGFLLLQQPPAFPCGIMQMNRTGYRDEFESWLYMCLSPLLCRDCVEDVQAKVSWA